MHPSLLSATCGMEIDFFVATEPMDIDENSSCDALICFLKANMNVCEGEGFFSVLSVDLLQEVFRWINDDTAYGRAAQVNKRWYYQVQSAWKKSAKARGLLEDEASWLERGRDWKWICHCHLRVYLPEQHKNGPGTFQDASGGVYRGDFFNNQKHGYGEYTLGDSVYKGGWQDDKKTNWGTMISTTNGGRYEGDWKDDKKSGKGIYYYANGDVYNGEWADGAKNGKGLYTFGKGIWEGDTYEGEWQNDKKCGEGRYVWKDGDIFVGQFKNDNFNGTGTYFYFSCGDKYVGEWVDDAKKGNGMYTYAHGGKYCGEFKNNKRHGVGTFIWKDGDRFEGFWVKGSRRGKGVFVGQDGTKEVQIWDQFGEAFDANYSKVEPSKAPLFQFWT